MLTAVLAQGPDVQLTAKVGKTLELTAKADGPQPFTYQWYRDNKPITGSTQAVVTFPNLVLADTGTFKCVISNSDGSATTNNVVLVVTAAVPPSNASATGIIK